MRQGLVFVGIGGLVIVIGLILINQRFMHSAYNEGAPGDISLASTTMSSFSLSSSAFSANASIPSQYTCDLAAGTPSSPPLSISGTPEGAKVFALIVEDPDVPKQSKPDGVFLHWLVFNIPAGVTELIEGASVGVPGQNGAGKNGYAGPCPPGQYQPNEHRYIFTLYALDKELPLEVGATKDDVMKAMKGHVIAKTELIGRYKRK